MVGCGGVQCLIFHSRNVASMVPGIFSLLISTLPVHAPAFFPKTYSDFLLLAVANSDSCVGPQNKIGHPAGCRFLCRVPAEYKWDKKKIMTCGMITREMSNLEIE